MKERRNKENRDRRTRIVIDRIVSQWIDMIIKESKPLNTKEQEQ